MHGAPHLAQTIGLWFKPSPSEHAKSEHSREFDSIIQPLALEHLGLAGWLLGPHAFFHNAALVTIGCHVITKHYGPTKQSQSLSTVDGEPFPTN